MVESAPFEVTASGFWISAGSPIVPIFQALSEDKREHGGTNLHLAFTENNGIIPQSPICFMIFLQYQAQADRPVVLQVLLPTFLVDKRHNGKSPVIWDLIDQDY